MRVIPSRRNDPPTSHRAEKSVVMRATSQKAKLLAAFATGGYLIDEEAAQIAGITHPRACFWKRCGELREDGLIEWAIVHDAPLEKRSSAGEWCQASVITPLGRLWLRNNKVGAPVPG